MDVVAETGGRGVPSQVYVMPNLVCFSTGPPGPLVGLCFRKLHGFQLPGSNTRREIFFSTRSKSLDRDYRGLDPGSLGKSSTLVRWGLCSCLVKELARCAERNKNLWNAVPVGVIHHRGTDGSSEGLPQAPALLARI